MTTTSPPTGSTCAAFYSVSQCNRASKTCQLVSCGSRPGPDEHHCAPDGG